MAIIFFRAAILYFALLLVTRLMGKRELGQMQPFETVIFMLMANLASVPMSDTGVPIFTGMLGISALLAVQTLLAVLLQKLPALRGLVSGQPTILICRGQINLDMMRRTRYTFDDLMGQLRGSGIYSAAQVEYAILETDGSLSILEKAEPAPQLPFILVMDGRVQRDSLARSGYEEKWLKSELKKQGYSDIRQVAYASMDTPGQVSVLPAMDRKERVRP